MENDNPLEEDEEVEEDSEPEAQIDEEFQECDDLEEQNNEPEKISEISSNSKNKEKPSLNENLFENPCENIKNDIKKETVENSNKKSIFSQHSLPNSIHSIIQARKISISPTNNINEPNNLNQKIPIENTFGKLSINTEKASLKKPTQKYQRQISINTSVLENSYNKKSTPLSKENSTTNKNNMPTEKVRQKTFNFVNTIFNPKSPNSPNRTILFSEYLIQRLGEERFKKMKSYLETSTNPLKILDEERSLVAEFIGEDNLDCIKIFKYLMTNVVTPSKTETIIKINAGKGIKGNLFEEFKGKNENG